MSNTVEESADLLRDARVDVLAFHCTAVSTWDPSLEGRILRRIEGRRRVPAIATSQALIAALKSLGARRIVMLSPYLEHIAVREQAYFSDRGFQVIENKFLRIPDPHGMLAVTPGEWLSQLDGVRRPDAEVYVVSCTATRAFEVVTRAEALLGRPVITSNSAMLWHATRHVGIQAPLAGCGALGAI